MVLHGECTICKETREGSKYRKVSEDSKIKAEAGRCVDEYNSEKCQMRTL